VASRDSRFAVSDHCDGTRFFNVYDRTMRGMRDVWRWRRQAVPVAWPTEVHDPRQPLPPARVDEGQIAVSFIGHATFLVRVGSLGVLTDPVFTSHAGPLGRFGPRRVRPPAFAIDQLPDVRVVLVSHNHYDHLQPKSLRALEQRFAPQFVTGLGLSAYLKRLGLNRVIELDWWQRTEDAAGTRITYVPAQHFSRRGLRDTNRSLWGGFVIERRDRSVYYAADSAYCPHFAEIGRRFPSLDVALMPIGAYEPRWFMNIVHVNPEESVRALHEVGAKHAVAMHFGSFQLTDEGIDEPVEALNRELAKPENSGLDFRVPAHGETLMF
jgi:L-ascorbate metabolism protein UlaG (beta-lactamase superfamily)